MTTDIEEAAPSSGDVAAAPRPSLRERLVPPMPDDGAWGWLGPLAVTLVGAVLRLWHLGQPHAMVFDETYYVKDGLSLVRFGYERTAVENADTLLLSGNANVFTDKASFVVHPPMGKWVIGLGEWVLGPTPTGWRISTAVLGILVVLMTARIGRRLTRSTLLGSLAGLLVALDGMAIVLSRTALLDGVLTFFVIAAFGCLLVDRDNSRQRLASWAEARTPQEREALLSGGVGPRLGLRPWRIAAGLLLGLACATKWSGLWFIVAFGLLTVAWDVGARRAVGVRHPLGAMLARDALPAFLSVVPTAIAVYAVSWSAWLATYSQQQRDWQMRLAGPGWLPEQVQALLGYHLQMLQFHRTLTSPHNYASAPIGWLLQVRPTAFWTGPAETTQGTCGAANCSREVIALGTPVLWWGACLALVYLVWRWLGRRDWRAGAVLNGVAAAWLPWVLLFSHRTVFASYMVVVVPFLALALVLGLGAVLGPADADPRRRGMGAAAVGAFVLVVLMNLAWIHPLLVGDSLPYEDWVRRLMFRGWI